MFWVFFFLVVGQFEARGVLAHWAGIEPTTPILEGKVLTAGLPVKSRYLGF